MKAPAQIGQVRFEWGGRFLLVAGSILCACLVAEGAFRLVGWRQGIDYRLYLKELTNPDRLPRALFRRDARLGTVLAPEVQVLAVTSDFAVVYRTNSASLRDQEYPATKPPDTLRVLALGDSFTFGEGVAYGERFTDVPENEIAGLEIINAGVPGWGIETELAFLALEGVRYRPDWVIVFLNFIDTARPLPDLVRDGRVELPTADAAVGGELQSSHQGDTWYVRADDPFFRDRGVLARNSYALSYLLFRVTLARRRSTFEQYDARYWRAKGGPLFAAPAPSAPVEVKVGEERTLVVLRKFAELAKVYGFRLMIVNIDPFLSLSYVAGVEASIRYHDFTPLLVERSQHERLFFTYDMHYNPGTHALIGRRLVDLLRPLVDEQRAQVRGTP
jgi:hypothetical protein